MTPNPKNRARGYLREPPTPEQFERVTLGMRGRQPGSRYELAVTANLVATNASTMRRLVVDAVVGDGAGLVQIDLWACHHIDARGFGMLVSIARWCQRHSVALVLVGVSADIRTRMRDHDVEKLFAIQEAEPADCHSPEAYFS